MLRASMCMVAIWIIHQTLNIALLWLTSLKFDVSAEKSQTFGRLKGFRPGVLPVFFNISELGRSGTVSWPKSIYQITVHQLSQFRESVKTQDLEMILITELDLLSTPQFLTDFKCLHTLKVLSKHLPLPNQQAFINNHQNSKNHLKLWQQVLRQSHFVVSTKLFLTYTEISFEFGWRNDLLEILKKTDGASKFQIKNCSKI